MGLNNKYHIWKKKSTRVQELLAVVPWNKIKNRKIVAGEVTVLWQNFKSIGQRITMGWEKGTEIKSHILSF